MICQFHQTLPPPACAGGEIPTQPIAEAEQEVDRFYLYFKSRIGTCDLLNYLITLVPPDQCAAKQPLTKTRNYKIFSGLVSNSVSLNIDSRLTDIKHTLQNKQLSLFGYSGWVEPRNENSDSLTSDSAIHQPTNPIQILSETKRFNSINPPCSCDIIRR